MFIFIFILQSMMLTYLFRVKLIGKELHASKVY